jgi:hypothetical protein
MHLGNVPEYSNQQDFDNCFVLTGLPDKQNDMKYNPLSKSIIALKMGVVSIFEMSPSFQ